MRVLSALLALLLAPSPIPPERAGKILSARNLGLAQLEEGKNKEARRTFQGLTELVPGEALPYANGAVAALRDNDFPGAEKLLAQARKAAGESAPVLMITAALEEARNRPEESRAALLKAASLDPGDLEARWRLVRSVEAIPNPSPALLDARHRALVELGALTPANLAVRLKLLLTELERGAAATAEAKKQLAELQKLLADGDAKTRQFLGEATSLLEKEELKPASIKARVLENLLRITPRYQQSLGELFTNVTGLPLLSFGPQLEASLRPHAEAPVSVTLREGGTAEDPAVTLRRVDLPNSGSPELYRIPAPFTEALFFDFDLEGDLDVYLLAGGKPDQLIRNNLDGSFTDVTGATGDPAFTSRAAVTGDFDRDGDPDIAAIDAKGDLVLRSNQRQGRFQSVPLGVNGAEALATDDLNADGALDLVVATRDGLLVLVNKGDGTFTREELGGLGKLEATFEPKALLLADLDNDGFPDLVVSGAKGLAAFRRSSLSAFTEWPILPKGTAPAERMIAYDADKDGDLDIVLSRGAKGSLLTNNGGNANGWLVVVLETLPASSGKVNKGGVGSVVEVKAGDLYVARTVGLLPTHAGLGSRSRADVVRVLFTNGVPQNLFDQKARSVAREVQQLKGSCPFVYAFDGENGRWSFVSDALGRAPLGLLYDGIHVAGADTREWLYVDGPLLSPTPDGRLLIDYTEELWEAAYLDEATLMAVDHPGWTLVVPNERMVPHPLERVLYTAARPRPARAATSIVNGTSVDVLDLLLTKDERYVNPGPSTHYQGICAEHELILDLGPIEATSRVVLFLDGWIFYTDTSINVSVSQRSDIRPFPPILEVPDGKGRWKTAIESFGFPAGKTKKMAVDLTGLLDPADSRVRIRTTSEIYWDQLFLTVDDPPVPTVTTLLSPRRATLSVRGFSRGYRRTPDGPELFDHDDVTPGPRWQDVPGLLTRLGDVTELLEKTDDRYVAFQGGDAIRIEYDATPLPPLPTGWRRDWVLVSDGWDKDFDKNTIASESVEPWPYHAMPGYPYPAGERFPDPEFLREWMTRETGPMPFLLWVRDFIPAPRVRR